MRIISGSKRGHRLLSPRGLHTRPTSDRMREDLFNLIEVRETDNFLDLFAGSGAVGIEALSRGANKSTFVEQDKRSYEILLKNLEQTDFNKEEDSLVIRSSVENAIKNLSRNEIFNAFDIVFLDPPYNMGWIQKTIDVLIEYKTIKKGGLLIIEADKKEEFSCELDLLKEKEYKYASLLIYRV